MKENDFIFQLLTGMITSSRRVIDERSKLEGNSWPRKDKA